MENATTFISTQDLVCDRTVGACTLSPHCISNLNLKTANFYLVNFSCQKVSKTLFIYTKLENIEILNNFIKIAPFSYIQAVGEKMEKFTEFIS